VYSVVILILSLQSGFRYSCTEGKTWENYTLPTSPRIKADGMLNEPGITSRITRYKLSMVTFIFVPTMFIRLQ